jgi:hypothetical protein
MHAFGRLPLNNNRCSFYHAEEASSVMDLEEAALSMSLQPSPVLPEVTRTMSRSNVDVENVER